MPHDQNTPKDTPQTTQPTNKQRVTRLAPSPTGALHLGNIRTFLINWTLARKNKWQIVLRIEDLDSPRVKQGASDQAIKDLTWLGLDWDRGPYHQLSDINSYNHPLDALREKKIIYPCPCSRKEIQLLQSAPQAGSHELRYPGTCKDKHTPSTIDLSDPKYAWRIRVPATPITITDQFAHTKTFDIAKDIGDFILKSKNAMPTYQIAVVIDDIKHHITDIVRGDDLYHSAARQSIVYNALQSVGLASAHRPNYWHLPLVLGPDRRRLAKRHGDSRLSMYRSAGVNVKFILGLMAYWCQFIPQKKPIDLKTWYQKFDLNKISKKPIIMQEEDHQWLLTSIKK